MFFSGYKKVVFAAVVVCLAWAGSPVFAGGKAEGAGGSSRDLEGQGTLPPMTLTLGVIAGPSGLGIVKLMEELDSLPESVSVEFVLLPSQLEMAAKLTTGELQGGVLPLNMAAKLYTAGTGYPLAAVPGWGNLFLISRDPAVRTWKDLAGKTVYSTGKGATPDYLFRYMAGKAGLDVEKVAVDYSFPAPQLAQLAASGRADTVLVPQPFAAMVLARGQGMEVRINLQEEWKRLENTDNTYPMTAFVLSRDFAEGRPEAYRTLMAAYRDSINWVLANPAEASLAVERQGILAADPARLAIPQSGLDFASAAGARKDVEGFLSVLLELDPQSVGNVLPDGGFYLAP